MELIPSQAPFSPEQAAQLTPLLTQLTPDQSLWLSGYLAGRASLSSGVATPAAPAKALSVTVLYGTESGNAEALGAEAVKRLKKQGFKPVLKDMEEMTPEDLKKVEYLLVIVSTWGEGDPPERAVEFYEALMADGAPKLEKTHFAVCGLGDTAYEHFCQMGKDFEARLEALGAKRLCERVDCDVDYDELFDQWMGNVLKALADEQGASSPSVSVSAPAATLAPTNWSKTNPFTATLQERIVLNGTGSAKETVHLELSLEGSGLTYLPGDAIGVRPSNCPEVIDELISVTGFNPDKEVNRPDGSAGSLRAVLIEELDSTVPSKKLMESYAKVAKNDKLDELVKSSKQVKEYTNGREIADLFADFYASKEFTPQQLVELLRVLPARLYSIASSISAHPEEVHMTVGAVRYESHGKKRKGVASTFLADRVQIGDTVPVYVHANNNFRLPENNDTPIIMIGPGTGIAPFRAFIEERAERSASGKNWLFFGDQHYSYDFLYQLEWQDYLKDGVLTQLDVAFSRDAPEKVYVQHRMREHAKQFWQWLEEGAHVYVCGDATRMAKDVNDALIDIVAEQGNLKPAEAKKFVTQLSKDKRYQRDVY